MADPENQVDEGKGEEEEQEENEEGEAINGEEVGPSEEDQILEEEEDEQEEIEEDPFELLDDESQESDEQKRKYKEYLELVKEIDLQNSRILDLKVRASLLRHKNCPTSKDQREYQRLRVNQEQENVKLRNMINRAMQLQNYGSRRIYGDVMMATTDFEEDIFVAGALQKKPGGTILPGGGSCTEYDSDDSDDRFCMP
ncbi:histone H3.v1 [Scaptodrosophila lebanonensis]|uniref:Histone H3.v1 n=1 Tax=Drosophila lebanonensis TaxID=7225 RepID=A0A6J2TK75_DROLE|nr:histone H3.v1 [Scaptodrosophila lebanonensis]